MKTIAERFLLLRGKSKQGDFAESIGINPNTLRSYESGRSFPNQELLERICVQFSVSPDWLLLGRGPMRLGEQTAQAGVAPEPVQSMAFEAENKLLRELKASQDETIKAQAETIKMYKMALEVAQQSAFKGDHGMSAVPPCARPAHSFTEHNE